MPLIMLLLMLFTAFAGASGDAPPGRSRQGWLDAIRAAPSQQSKLTKSLIRSLGADLSLNYALFK